MAGVYANEWFRNRHVTTEGLTKDTAKNRHILRNTTNQPWGTRVNMNTIIRNTAFNKGGAIKAAFETLDHGYQTGDEQVVEVIVGSRSAKYVPANAGAAAHADRALVGNYTANKQIATTIDVHAENTGTNADPNWKIYHLDNWAY